MSRLSDWKRRSGRRAGAHKQAGDSEDTYFYYDMDIWRFECFREGKGEVESSLREMLPKGERGESSKARNSIWCDFEEI